MPRHAQRVGRTVDDKGMVSSSSTKGRKIALGSVDTKFVFLKSFPDRGEAVDDRDDFTVGFGFDGHGLPESRVTSFGSLVYASSWLKCHEPETFLTAMLNSQPMGFYSPCNWCRAYPAMARRVDIQRDYCLM